MYLYFNSKGVLEEVVNDLPTRKDSSNVNHIYVYIDGVNYDTDDEYYPLPSTITSLSTRYQLPDGTITPTALVNDKVRLSIPYDKHRDMKCFKDFTNYEFFDIELPSGVNEDGSQSEMPNVLGQSGLVALTIITQPQSLALGLVVFTVEEEVGITTDTLITEAQFNYIINYITKYTSQIDVINKVIPAGTTPTNKLTNIANVKELIDANIPTFDSSTIWTNEFMQNVAKVGYALFKNDRVGVRLYSVFNYYEDSLINICNIHITANAVYITERRINKGQTIEEARTYQYNLPYYQEGAIKYITSVLEDNDATNKSYVDSKEATLNIAINNRVAKISVAQKGGSIVYGRDSNGNDNSVNYRTQTTYGNDLIYRDNNGRAEVNEPVSNKEIANKLYVDDTIKSQLSTVYKYKGTVETYADLPTNASVGDTYNVVEAYETYPAGTNYSWNGTTWDALGGSVDLSNYVSNDELTETLKNYQPTIGYGTNLYVRFLNVNKLASIYENGDADFQNVKVGNLLHLYSSGDVVFDTDTSTGGFHYYASSGALDLKGDLNINGNKIHLWADSGSMDIQNINLKGYLRDGNNQTTVKEIVDNLSKYVETTYANLKSLRDNSQLKKGFTYRITDFVTTTSQFDTQSANHPFDILVIADDVNVLNENAKAIKHSGDTYFANSKLESWELKYCLDNDTNRFVWASTNGKGVIYYMKDEFNNECPYDFKNIQFKRYKINKITKLKVTFEELYNAEWEQGIFNECLAPTQDMSGLEIDTTTFTWCYTFNDFENNNIEAPIDMSLFNRKANENVDYSQFYYAFDNHISKLMVKQSINENELLTSQQLNNIVFTTYDIETDGWQFRYDIYGNVFETNCYNITFTRKSYGNTMKANCYDIVGGNNCFSNTFGNNCYYNTFGNDCSSNTFGNNCYYNTFGNNCYYNTFGNDCSSNTFGNNCYYNTFGNDCSSNTFGNDCSSNTFGNNCYYNTFGNNCYYNTFGNNCYYNTLLDRASNNDNAQYAQYNIFENGVKFVQLTSDDTASNANQLQNVTIHQGVKGTSRTKKVVTVSRNVQHSIDVYAEGSETINV